MEEQVELDFTIKSPVKTMQSLVEMLNSNHLVSILTVTEDSADREMIGPVFLYLPETWSGPIDRWEYKIARPPITAYCEYEPWLNKLGLDGWEIYRMPSELDLDSSWFFKRKAR